MQINVVCAYRHHYTLIVAMTCKQYDYDVKDVPVTPKYLTLCHLNGPLTFNLNMTYL
jgi:hypothetical protein